MKLSSAELLRRAVADARRAAETANRTAWRAQRRALAAKEAAAAYARSGAIESLATFATTETTRLHVMAMEGEGQAWELQRATGQLADLLGAKVQEPR